MSYSLTPYRTQATKYLSRTEAVRDAREAVGLIGLTDVRVSTVLSGSRFYGLLRSQDAIGFVKKS